MNVDPTEQLILALGRSAFENAVLKAQIEALRKWAEEAERPPASDKPSAAE